MLRAPVRVFGMDLSDDDTWGQWKVRLGNGPRVGDVIRGSASRVGFPLEKVPDGRTSKRGTPWFDMWVRVIDGPPVTDLRPCEVEACTL